MSAILTHISGFVQFTSLISNMKKILLTISRTPPFYHKKCPSVRILICYFPFKSFVLKIIVFMHDLKFFISLMDNSLLYIFIDDMILYYYDSAQRISEEINK